MTSLGHYLHDFPRLAEQSGYDFQLYRGIVNWPDIETLNVQDIIEKKDFQLLERNLINVINCNLEREFELKNLDRNFVKLFQIAQLGIDYLSYCELYLDKCVVLLQEKLVSLEKECQTLKEQKAKRKNKSQQKHFQCEKCEKIFISEIYLKHHEKRRHSPATKYLDESPTPRKSAENCHQEKTIGKKSSASTQTSFNEEEEEERKLKKENHLKIENLEKALNELKNRLEKAENALVEKSDGAGVNPPFSFSLPTPVFYPSMLPFFPSHSPQAGNNYSDNNHMQSNSSVPENRQLFSCNFSKERNVSPKAEPSSSKSTVSNSVKDFQLDSEVIEKESLREKLQDSSMELEKKRPERSNEVQEELEKETVNLNFGAEKSSSVSSTPVPFPRRMKVFRQTAGDENQILAKPSASIRRNVHDSEAADSVIPLVPGRDSPSRKEKIISKDSSEYLNEKNTSSSSGSFVVEEEATISGGRKSNSFIGKIMAKSSPRLVKLRRNLKRSLTNLYDSVSMSTRDLNRADEGGSKAGIQHSCHVPSREEPSGQKVKEPNKGNQIKFSPKVNSAPGKSLEREGILKKLRRSHLIFGGRKNVSNKPVGEDLAEIRHVIQDGGRNGGKEKEGVRVKASSMYDLGTDSESETSRNPDDEKENVSSSEIGEEERTSDVESIGRQPEKDFDFSVFQVGAGKMSANENPAKNLESKLFDVDPDQINSSDDGESLKGFGPTGIDSCHDRNGKTPRAEPERRNGFGKSSEEVQLVEMDDSVFGSKSNSVDRLKGNFVWSEDSDSDTR